jgi:amidohydrolase
MTTLVRIVSVSLAALAAVPPLKAQASRLDADVDRRVPQVVDKVVAWRRDIHAHPELSNRETRTADLVAQELRSLGLEVRTGVAHTGVVAVLRGRKPGPVVALRADMDALPVTEEVDVPFASKVRTTYNAQEVGVMHACGHDAHTAMLMGVAEVLSSMRNELPGTVKFIFQPAEEGVPAGEQGGASLMIAEGTLENPKPNAIFGLHVWPYQTGEIRYRPGGFMASSNSFRIVVHGRQTHGALPWAGIDPIVIASQIVLGLQTIASRQIDVTAAPAVVTVGAINGGVRNNIIPDSVVMIGTIRTFDAAVRRDVFDRVQRTAASIAQSAGASAAVAIDSGNPVTYNDPALTEQLLPTLRAVAGADHVSLAPPITAAEDFSRFEERVPGVFFFLGIVPQGTDPRSAAPNHSPRFFVDEAAFPIGIRALAHAAVDYLAGGH